MSLDLKNTNNWKDLLIQNPFLPVRYLKYKFSNFNHYDLTNWEKKSHVKSILNREKWRLNKNINHKDAKRILTSIWRFYLCRELNLDFERDQEIISKLIHLKNDRKHPLSSLLHSGKYMRKIKGYEAWKANGHTLISFVICNLFPGQEWVKKNFISPSMFMQTSFKTKNHKEVLALMELIWLRHIQKITSECEEEINSAKRNFYARHLDIDLFKRRKWQDFGLSATLQTGGIKILERELAQKFGNELGIIKSKFLNAWNAREFKQRNPDLNLERCSYTKTYPVDLHHFLERSKYPQFIYHPENVVALDPQIHAFITRGKWSKSLQNEYVVSQNKWIKAKDGKKFEVFDGVMKKIISEINR